jgi:hypothetical protein
MSEVIGVRALNSAGIAAVTSLLLDIESGAEPEIDSVLNSPVYSEAVDGLEIERRPFRNRLDAGGHLFDALKPLRRSRIDVLRNRGMWTWLALSWINILAPQRSDGSRKLFDHRRWVLSVDDYRAYYRHHLAGPYSVYAAHADDPSRTMALLCGSIEKPGEVWEQIASNQDFVSSPGLVALATHLYFDPSTGLLKRGAAAKDKGGARRLTKVMRQFSLTWEIRDMPLERLLALLPAEFDRFK